MKRLLFICVCLCFFACKKGEPASEAGTETAQDSLSATTDVDMSSAKTFDFEDVSAEEKPVDSLKNYTEYRIGSAGTVICGCLEYINDNGREFNYKAISNCSVECILSINGSVTSTSGKIDMKKGDTYKVGLRPGQVHGWVCW